ncbi:hypothetical protein BN2537_16877 [Streptomyces venezuelae]|nr:hypothetical protein BN2537_16877 [Streptomyces venezuelae]
MNGAVTVLVTEGLLNGQCDKPSASLVTTTLLHSVSSVHVIRLCR